MEKVQVSEKVSGYIYFLKSSNNENYILNYINKGSQYFGEKKTIYKKPLEYLRWIFDHSATWIKVLGMLKVLQTSVDGYMFKDKYLKNMVCFGKGIYTDGFYWWIYILLKRSQEDAVKEIES